LLAFANICPAVIKGVQPVLKAISQWFVVNAQTLYVSMLGSRATQTVTVRHVSK